MQLWPDQLHPRRTSSARCRHGAPGQATLQRMRRDLQAPDPQKTDVLPPRDPAVPEPGPLRRPGPAQVAAQEQKRDRAAGRPHPQRVQLKSQLQDRNPGLRLLRHVRQKSQLQGRNRGQLLQDAIQYQPSGPEPDRRQDPRPNLKLAQHPLRVRPLPGRKPDQPLPDRKAVPQTTPAGLRPGPSPDQPSDPLRSPHPLLDPLLHRQPDPLRSSVLRPGPNPDLRRKASPRAGLKARRSLSKGVAQTKGPSFPPRPFVLQERKFPTRRDKAAKPHIALRERVRCAWA